MTSQLSLLTEETTRTVSDFKEKNTISKISYEKPISLTDYYDRSASGFVFEIDTPGTYFIEAECYPHILCPVKSQEEYDDELDTQKLKIAEFIADNKAKIETELEKSRTKITSEIEKLTKKLK